MSEKVESPNDAASPASNGSPESQAAPGVNQPKKPLINQVELKPDGTERETVVIAPDQPVQRIQLSHLPSEKIAVEIHNPPNSKGFWNG